MRFFIVRALALSCFSLFLESSSYSTPHPLQKQALLEDICLTNGESVSSLFENWTETAFSFLNEKHFEGGLKFVAFEAKAKIVLANNKVLAAEFRKTLTDKCLLPTAGETKKLLLELFLCRMGVPKQPQDQPQGLKSSYTHLIPFLAVKSSHSLEDIKQDPEFQNIKPETLKLLVGANRLLTQALNTNARLSSMNVGTNLKNKKLKKLPQNNTTEEDKKVVFGNLDKIQIGNGGDLNPQTKESAQDHMKKMRDSSLKASRGSAQHLRKSSKRYDKSVYLISDPKGKMIDQKSKEHALSEEVTKNSDEKDLRLNQLAFISRMNQLALDGLRETFPEEEFSLADLQQNVKRLNARLFINNIHNLHKLKNEFEYLSEGQRKSWIKKWKKIHFIFENQLSIETKSDGQLLSKIADFLKENEPLRRKKLKFPCFQEPLDLFEDLVFKLSNKFGLKPYQAKLHMQHFEQNTGFFYSNLEEVFNEIKKNPDQSNSIFSSFSIRFKELFHFSRFYFASIQKELTQQEPQHLLSLDHDAQEFPLKSMKKSVRNNNRIAINPLCAKDKKEKRGFAHSHSEMIDEKNLGNAGMQTRKRTAQQLFSQKTAQQELDQVNNNIDQSVTKKGKGERRLQQSTEFRFKQQRLNSPNELSGNNVHTNAHTSQNDVFTNNLLIPQQNALNNTETGQMIQEEGLAQQNTESRFKQQRLNSPNELSGNNVHTNAHTSQNDVFTNNLLIPQQNALNNTETGQMIQEEGLAQQNTESRFKQQRLNSSNELSGNNAHTNARTSQNDVFTNSLNNLLIPQQNALNNTERRQTIQEEGLAQQNTESVFKQPIFNVKQEGNEISFYMNNPEPQNNSFSQPNTFVVNNISVDLKKESTAPSKWIVIEEGQGHNNPMIERQGQGRYAVEDRGPLFTIYQMGELLYKQFQTRLYDVSFNPAMLNQGEEVFSQIQRRFALRNNDLQYSVHHCSPSDLDHLVEQFGKVREDKRPWSIFCFQNRREEYTKDCIVNWSVRLYYLVLEQGAAEKRGEPLEKRGKTMLYPEAQKSLFQQRHQMVTESRIVAQRSAEGWLKQNNNGRYAPPLKSRMIPNAFYAPNQMIEIQSSESSIDNESQERAELEIVQNLSKHALEEIKKHLPESQQGQQDFDNLSKQMGSLSLEQKADISKNITKCLQGHQSNPYWDKARFIVPAWFKSNKLTMTSECQKIADDFRAKYRLEKQKNKEIVFSNTVNVVQRMMQLDQRKRVNQPENRNISVMQSNIVRNNKQVNSFSMHSSDKDMNSSSSEEMEWDSARDGQQVRGALQEEKNNLQISNFAANHPIGKKMTDRERHYKK